MSGVTPVEKYQKLAVKGRNLVDAKGEIVQLRGISSHSIPEFPQFINREMFLQMRDEWKVDVVRLAMYTAEKDGYCVGDDANRDRIKKVIFDGVEYAKELGLYVIIDWHILSDSNPLMHVDQARVFWEEMSKKYADYDNVIYELCNEPNVEATWADVKTYADEMIEIIRKNDKDSIILVGTPVWSQRVDEAYANPVSHPENVMYVIHFYADTHREELRNLFKEYYDKGLPIFCSEFGITDASGDNNINKEQGNIWIKLFNECQTSYCIWNLSNKDEDTAFFVPTCEKVSGFVKEDLREQALWYLDILQNF